METPEQVLEAVRECGLEACEDQLRSQILPSVRLTCLPDQPPGHPLGASRLGGLPDLPDGIAWPNFPGYVPPPRVFRSLGGPRGGGPTLLGGPLVFLGQINLREAAPHDAEGLLPPTGILSFFAALWVTSITENDPEGLWRVLYHDAPSGDLRRLAVPPIAEELSASYDYWNTIPEGHQFRPGALTLSREMTLPTWHKLETNLEDYISDEDDGSERYQTLLAKIYPSGDDEYFGPPVWRMLGHPQFEGDPYPPDEPGTLLLQLESEHRHDATPTDIRWELGGDGFFFLTPDQLKARDFLQVDLYMEVD